MVFHTKTPAHVCSRIIYGSSSNYRDSAGGISEALCSVMRHPAEEKIKACLNRKTSGINQQRAKTTNLLQKLVSVTWVEGDE